MTATNSLPAEPKSLWRNLPQAARHYLSGRRGWIALAIVAIGGGLVLNWSWLVAIGVAPFLITLLPCAAMCALGLCMHRGAKGSCHSSPQEPSTRGPQAVPGEQESVVGKITFRAAR